MPERDGYWLIHRFAPAKRAAAPAAFRRGGDRNVRADRDRALKAGF
jgi:hypothetical protein